MSAVLGVDPTATGSGAAVLRVDGVVVACWAWTLTARGWRVRTSDVVECVYPGTTLEGIGYVVGCDVARRVGDARLVVEGLFVPPRWARRSSGADVIVLAEATGATIAGLRRAGLGEPSRPLAKDWRRPFGWAGLDAKKAEGAAMQTARLAGWLPRGLTAAEQGAVAEAGAMALWSGV